MNRSGLEKELDDIEDKIDIRILELSNYDSKLGVLFAERNAISNLLEKRYKRERISALFLVVLRDFVYIMVIFCVIMRCKYGW
ncbi:MAG: hypothetical protein FWC15_05130 [Fibromonadales bacterium]|nr:hypothetical protein [Fibromonadales bacterium]